MATEEKAGDGGPATCRACGCDFGPKPYQVAKADYECPPCKRARQNAANEKRDLAAISKARYSRPDVKRAVAEAHRRRKADPEFRKKRAARRKVATEIEAGRLLRGPCECCGAPSADAHHHDYDQPLAVRWLCRRCHFREEHRADPVTV